MKIIALTGGVASGKNYISDIFSEFGAKIFDADKIVHEILENDQEVIKKISVNFNEAVINSKIDRKILGSLIFKNKEKIKILEQIIHPIVRKKYQDFLQKSQRDNVEIIILNIPLLLEKGGYDYDILVAIITDLEIRKERFIARELNKLEQDDNPELRISLEEKFNNIVKNQISSDERIEKADFVLDGNSNRNSLIEKIKEIL